MEIIVQVVYDSCALQVFSFAHLHFSIYKKSKVQEALSGLSERIDQVSERASNPMEGKTEGGKGNPSLTSEAPSKGPGWALRRKLATGHLKMNRTMDIPEKTVFSIACASLPPMIRFARFRRGAYSGPSALCN